MVLLLDTIYHHFTKLNFSQIPIILTLSQIPATSNFERKLFIALTLFFVSQFLVYAVIFIKYLATLCV